MSRQPVKCPYCRIKTVPTGDGVCAGCGKQVAAPHRVAADDQVDCWIGERAQLPQVCVSCGRFTDQRIKIKRTRKIKVEDADNNQGSALLEVLGCLLGLVLGPLALLVTSLTSNRQAQRQKVQVRLPQCPMCQAEVQIEPTVVDYLEKNMAFRVHRQFLDSWSKRHSAH